MSEFKMPQQVTWGDNLKIVRPLAREKTSWVVNYLPVEEALAREDEAAFLSALLVYTRELILYGKTNNPDARVREQLVQDALDGIHQFARISSASPWPGALRPWFAQFTAHFVAHLPMAQLQSLHFFYCPMAEQFGYWVQGTPLPLFNPYMGQKMAQCGRHTTAHDAQVAAQHYLQLH